MKRFALCSLTALVLVACQDSTEPKVGTRVDPRPSLLVTPSSAPSPPLAYVANTNSNTVSVINTGSNTLVATVGVGLFPLVVAITPDGAFAYVTNGNSFTVSVIATSSNTVVATVAVDPVPIGVAITPDGAFAYVVNRGFCSVPGTVSVIETASNTVVATVAVGTCPVGVAITPDGAFAYVVNRISRTVSVIETASNTVVASVGVGVDPTGAAITPDGAFAYVTNLTSNTVSVIETANNTVVATVGVGNFPVSVAITPDGAFAYVAHAVVPDLVSVIETASNTVVATIGAGSSPGDLGDFPGAVAITPDGAFAYVVNRSSFTPGSSFISTTVSVINTGSNTVVATVNVGDRPLGVAITPSPTIEFAAFDIEHAHVELDEFEVEGSFTLGAGNDGIDVLNEDVTVTFDGFSQTILAGSFVRDKHNEGFKFDGTLPDGTRLEVEIDDDGEFEVKGRGIPELSGIALPSLVPFSVRIGDDIGETDIQFDDEGQFPAE